MKELVSQSGATGGAELEIVVEDEAERGEVLECVEAPAGESDVEAWLALTAQLVQLARLPSPSGAGAVRAVGGKVWVVQDVKTI